ncbi:hypothetical protein PS627_01202 [Pseudomonas fluorescens]|uniref:helix-turn-helix domain-containing protein n=1 Tax=Pseudomonas fluorescens TaxID=294 RepID=UPI001259C8C5|nr:hypothetical protein [Pseudomonas fluorescens]CAG8865293.1 hypothetical protein PS627_01202 [Pseudomonas fluorescens]
MLHAAACQTPTNANPLTLTQLRQVRDENHTRRVDNLIIDKRTGEIIGCYMHSQFSPELCSDLPQVKMKAARRTSFAVHDDGTPLAIEVSVAGNQGSADIIQFPPQAAKAKSNAGRPPFELVNPISGFLQYFRFDGHSTDWIDDRIVGACGVQVECEGGLALTTGRFNVSPSDVRRVLYLPMVSTETAATILCNHNLEPMGVRQVERIVKTARIALGGLMRHLECHPELLGQFDYVVDFEAFWRERSGHLRGESPDKAEAMRLYQQDPALTVTAVAKRYGVHRNTASGWKREALMHN